MHVSCHVDAEASATLAGPLAEHPGDDDSVPTGG
jgi:hypothetical protein